MGTPRRGHLYPIGSRVQKRVQGKGTKSGTVIEHTWVTAKNKARSQLPFYLVQFDGGAKAETVSASMLSPEGSESSERLF